MRNSVKRSLIILAGSLLMLSACDTEKVDLLKSPCVGAEGSPCGPKRALEGNA
jgi:hypothetical protein